MLAAIFILFIALMIIFFVPNYDSRTEEDEDEADNNPQLKKLWNLAQGAMREHKPLKAEKALLTILKFDERNAAAYNRLGILYAKEKHFKEAIECFEIAQSLDNNASSLHNVGLIYLETGKYEKAAMAFSAAIELEGDQPGRHIAYAKALEKLGERSKALESLETAYSLNPTTVILRHMLEIYEHNEDEEGIAEIKRRIEDLQIQRQKLEEEKAKQTKRTTGIRRPRLTKAAKAPKAPKPAKTAKTPRVIRKTKPPKVMQEAATPAKSITLAKPARPTRSKKSAAQVEADKKLNKKRKII